MTTTEINELPSGDPIVSGDLAAIDRSDGIGGYLTKKVALGTISALNSITSDNIDGVVAIAKGGTGSTTAAGFLNNLLPSQTGNEGKALSTDGTNPFWDNGLTLPSQTGHAGEFLTTDGTAPSWSGNPLGTVTSFAFTDANGISGTVTNPTTTPNLALALGAITPSSVNALTLAAQTVGFTIAGGTTSKTLTVPLDASVSGTNTGDQTSVSGNAGTATALQTARAIGIGGSTGLTATGVNFNGTAAINPALTGTLLGSSGGTGVDNTGKTITLGGNLATSGAFNLTATLTADTTVTFPTSGTLATTAGTVTTATNAVNIGITDDTTTNATMYPLWVTANTGNLPAKVASTKLSFNPSTATLSTTTFSGALTGNASTATALQTARAINGVNFDGTAAITVTAAAGTLTGATLNSGVTASSLTSFGASIALGTPASGTLTNCTGYPVANIANLGTGVASALATNVGSAGAPVLFNGAGGTPSSMTATNLTGTATALNIGGNAATASAVAVGGITGLGTGVAAALATNIGSAGAPVLFNGAGGTPSSITLTNASGTAASLTAGNVTTNANLTGAVTSSGNATSLGSFSSANLAAALTDETGTGVVVFGTSPRLTTSILDSNGNSLLLLTATGSAVNWMTLANAATGANATLTASGETNTGITITGKGTKGVAIGNALSEKVSTITDGAGAVIDCSLGNIFTWTAAADRTAGTTTNAVAGQKMIISFLASGGARTLTLPTATTGDFAYGSDITVLSQTASGKTDVIGCVYNSVIANRWAVVAYVKGY